MAAKMSSCLFSLCSVALLLLSTSPNPALAIRMPGQCSACRAVAAELVAKLEAEQPRNHLDMRHRFDKEGKRWGKVIDYKMSELRVIHLLEDLCDAMTKYELFDDSDGGQRWALTGTRFHGKNPAVEVTKQQRRELTNYCHDVLERHEEDVSEALRNGLVSSDTAQDFICLTTAKHCELSLAEEQAQEEAERLAVQRAEEERAQQAEQEAAAAGTKAADSAGGEEAEAVEGAGEAAGDADGSKEEL